MSTTPSSSSVSETLSRIFSDIPRERLVRRGSRRSNGDHELGVDAKSSVAAADSDPSRDAKRRKRDVSCPPDLFPVLTPDMTRIVAGFLDPFEVQALSCCCTATRDACTLAAKLDGIFRYFRILREYADRVHEARCDWNAVMNLMLEALKELRGVYGPYQIHPLHAAVVGELLFMVLASRGRDQTTTLEDVWSDRHSFSSCFVLGRYGDYFIFDEGIIRFREFALKNVDQFPAGAATALLQEGCMPFINIFCRKREEHTDHMGLSFPNGLRTKHGIVGDDEVLAHVFCASYQDLPYDEGEFLDWYSELPCYQNYTSIAQAFCQSVPLSSYAMDNWTQFLRAVWLRVHRIFPFDESDRGKTQWDRLVKSAGPALNEVSDDNDDESGVFPVLNFSEVDSVNRDDVKDLAKAYFRQKHDFAKGSDYH